MSCLLGKKIHFFTFLLFYRIPIWYLTGCCYFSFFWHVIVLRLPSILFSHGHFISSFKSVSVQMWSLIWKKKKQLIWQKKRAAKNQSCQKKVFLKKKSESKKQKCEKKVSVKQKRNWSLQKEVLSTKVANSSVAKIQSLQKTVLPKHRDDRNQCSQKAGVAQKKCCHQKSAAKKQCSHRHRVVRNRCRQKPLLLKKMPH